MQSHQYHIAFADGKQQVFEWVVKQYPALILSVDKNQGYSNTNQTTTFSLQNLRVTKVSNDIIEEDNYYPFGLKHSGYNTVSSSLGNSLAKKIKYNGKEMQDELNLNWYDYHARNYDPTLGRWMNVDPLAEKYPAWSPYVYVMNNPINAIDPDGKEIIFVVRGDKGTKNQTFTYRKGNFYHSNGKRYNPGKEGISKTMYKTLSAYRKIEASGDKELKGMLNTLETSKQKHFIEEGRLSAVIADPLSMSVSESNDKISKGVPVGTQTTFNFSETTSKDFEKDEGIPHSDFSTVVHEMQHQYDYDTGNMKDRQYPSSATSPQEIRAINTENKARKIESIPKRTTYGGKEIDSDKLN